MSTINEKITMSKLQNAIDNYGAIHSRRFVIYAFSNGNTPEEQLKIDAATHPRGKYEPFMLWSMTEIREWKMVMGMQRHYTPTQDEWFQYDQWLSWMYDKEK